MLIKIELDLMQTIHVHILYVAVSSKVNETETVQMSSIITRSVHNYETPPNMAGAQNATNTGRRMFLHTRHAFGLS